jgi:uncharacterized LabA/DUF88 family protein
MARQPKGNFAFIDNQNLNLGVQKMGWKMNWRRFREFLRDQYGVEKAFMFIGYMPNFEELYQQMHDHGFLVVLKPTLEMFNAPIEGAPAKPEGKADEKKPPVKGNVDAELVLYAVKEMPNYDKAVIVSGDGDFYSLVEYLDQSKKLLHLMTPNWQYSSLLKPYEPFIVRIDQHRRELEYYDFKKRKKPSEQPSAG